MKQKQSSIRVSISVLFIVLMVITLFTVGYILFSNWKECADSIIGRIENNVSKNISNEIEDLIDISLNTNENNLNLIQNGIIDMNNKEKRDVFFAGVVKASREEIYSFSYGLENGDYYGARRNKNNHIEIYRSTEETKGHSLYYSVNDDLSQGDFIEDFGAFDPRTRDWYKAAKEEGVPVFSQIYKHFVKDDLALSAAYPVYNKEGTLQGVLGTHITLSRLNRYLRESIEESGGIAYIVERSSGELVANSLKKPNFTTLSDGKINRIKIDEVEDKVFVKAWTSYKENLENSIVVKKEKDKFHIKLSDYKRNGLDWIIITSIPEAPFIGEINKNIHAAILLSIMALFLSVSIYMQSMEIILRPIDHLISITDRFSKGDLKQRAKTFKNNEIGKLSNAFNSMAEELHIHIDKLEEKVKERTVELQKTNSELKQAKLEADKALEMKDEFLSLVSHEFRTPLNVINSAIQAMTYICGGELSDKSKKYLGMIRQNTFRQLRLVNNLLDITRVNAGRIKINKSNIDIVFLTKAIIESVYTYASQKKIDVAFITLLEEKVIAIDEEKYERILLNLLSNAIKFTPEGNSIIVTLNAVKNRIYVKVRDSGIGIPEDKLDVIFERFGQVDSSLSRQAEGTGIGLSLVKKLTEALGGSISVNSKEGRGSTFTVVLPDEVISEDKSEIEFGDLLDNRLIQTTTVEFSDIYL
jgi:two-component system, sensor histidine kinase and response regulator